MAWHQRPTPPPPHTARVQNTLRAALSRRTGNLGVHQHDPQVAGICLGKDLWGLRGASGAVFRHRLVVHSSGSSVPTPNAPLPLGAQSANQR